MDAGSLPLETSIPSGEDDAAPLPQDDSEGDSAPAETAAKFEVPVMDRARMPERTSAIDTQFVENLPLVQAILKQTGGLLLSVVKSKKKENDAKA